MSLPPPRPSVENTAPSHRPEGLEAFGKYRIIGPLAKGGMAELSLAMQVGVEGFTRVVALKRVLAINAANTRFVQMFLDEARLAARLDHPQIVRIYELGLEQGAYFMAMEYLPGEDLQGIAAMSAAADQQIDPDIAAFVVQRAAEALHFAHELTDADGRALDLVHRDVNPSNILVTYQGHVKVVDFGIAKAATNTFETEVGMIKGKMGYLAPEQFSDGMVIDRRCDVFGLGIVLWELLAGTTLFRRESSGATLMAVRLGEVPSLRDQRPEIDPQLEAVVMKALNREPSQRYQTAAELEEALDRCLRNRSFRPSDRDLGKWLEGLGGTRKAELKKSIARGTNVTASFHELKRLGAANTPSVARPLPTSLRPRPLWQVAAFATAGLLAVGGAFAASMSRPRVHAPAAVTAGVQIDSDPPGAFIFVAGEPTGKVTPATMAGFPSGGLDVRLEKPGYTSVRASMALEAGKQIAQRFPLVAEQAIVQFAHVPEGGMVRIAGKTARQGEQLELPVGRAHLDVLVDGQVVVSKEVDLNTGNQTVNLR